ncbi:hypothetical protein EMIHUDRAFT_118401 [Emiliania huxleyi CCMP1516]|uniref:Amine oxidase domain-containing protein n=2 Tax=Emiliania huxleyi TaxID=2903 RepID=A0A0D3J4V8_EMIH1|nr:hypothetical protein EMIHUDRAFT_118401 [Emiliania huxleyi CCMP1516]EOD18543.1 hypothetical protein EMIHUDRAFT_118401 [Emiliania huxleyi CCMP1516]|eukprot:XP_005770972.1 hypothetical protein EMIHUDRAFT_118401 [Emiliania huxleyi CCMP1516]
MAGLYAAMLIKSLGIDFEELEAAEAPGGRVRTHHFSEEEWDYVDLGAMRVPKIPIMDRIDWKADPFHFSTSKGGNVPDKFVHEGPDHWLTKVIQEYLDALSKNFESGFRKLMSIDSMTGRQLLLDDRAPAASRTPIVIDNLDLGPAKLTDAMVAEIAAGHGPCVQTEHEFSKRYTHVITTVTNHAFRLMDTTDCNLSLAKRTAQRCLTYDHSTNVALKFKTRFWGRGAAPIHGGTSTTDLPIRQVVYPSYGSEWDTGVLIVSYSWADDADWMGSLALSDKTRAIELCVANLAEFSSMIADLISAEVDGRLLFAGEATSVHHAWIVGSLNSAYRAVDEILCREGLVEKRIELRNPCGARGGAAAPAPEGDVRMVSSSQSADVEQGMSAPFSLSSPDRSSIGRGSMVGET